MQQDYGYRRTFEVLQLSATLSDVNFVAPKCFCGFEALRPEQFSALSSPSWWANISSFYFCLWLPVDWDHWIQLRSMLRYFVKIKVLVFYIWEYVPGMEWNGTIPEDCNTIFDHSLDTLGFAINFCDEDLESMI